MSSIIDFLHNIVQGVTNIPLNIVNGIKNLFTPNQEEIQESFEDLTEEIEGKFGFDSFNFERLFTGETPIEDKTLNYTINGIQVSGKILDTTWLIQGVNYFRPYIRGFIALLIVLYNIKQAMSLFGWDSGMRNETQKEVERRDN